MVKPARTHHCRTCDECVFALDHHCPWINNCVGADNYRFFLLFLFYLAVGLAFNFISISSMWHHKSYQDHLKMFSFLSVLDCAAMITVTFFSFWSWCLSLKGHTTLEFWEGDDPMFFRFGFKKAKDNLYMIFGTYHIMRVFSPSLRTLPLSGIEWSFAMVEQGFDLNGIKVLDDIESRPKRKKKNKQQETEMTTLTSNQTQSELLTEEFDNIDN
mmetsp:Transcript_20112/g.27789  ORF Transcript_20112/g.27789 Transcript_20112/m.27789 type:complete len:214 (+) Transcript_20112:591-1232(+)